MSLTATTILEVESGGSATNGGGFDPSQTTGMNTDLADVGNTANTPSPVVSSASYPFQATDQNHWLFIPAGTSWTTGWYQIASVASGQATLNAAIGQAVLYPQLIPNTVAGCASVAHPTGGTFAIDYSQRTVAPISHAGSLQCTGTTTITDNSGSGWGNACCGNLVYITGGGATTGCYVIVSKPTISSAASMTLDRSPGTVTNGNIIMGGAFDKPGTAFGVMVGSNCCFIKKATYVQAANPTMNPAAVTPSNTVNATRIWGYNAVRGDAPSGVNRPTIQLSGGTFCLNPTHDGYDTRHLILDANSVASSTCYFPQGVYSRAVNVKCANFKNFGAQIGSSNWMEQCEVTGGVSGASSAINPVGNGVTLSDCYIHDNVCPGVASSGAQYLTLRRCIIYNNTGASSDGVQIGSSATDFTAEGNTIAANGRDGIRITYASLNINGRIKNNILLLNGGFGLNFSNTFTADAAFDGNFYGSSGQANTSGTRNGCGTGTLDVTTISVDPFTNKSAGDFSLNNTPNAGAAIRGAGQPNPLWPGGSTANYPDGGAVQHLDSGGSGGGLMRHPGMTGGVAA